MFSVLRFLLILSCAQHITAKYESFHTEPKDFDDIHVLADFLKYYISIVHGYNRQLISIKYSATSIEQTEKQSDIIRLMVEYAKDIRITYTFLDLNRYPNNLNNLRGLNILLVDNPNVFR